jgi:hypothetical protein
MPNPRGLTRSGLDDPGLAGAGAALEDDQTFSLAGSPWTLASSRSYSLAPSFAERSDAFMFSTFLALF